MSAARDRQIDLHYYEVLGIEHNETKEGIVRAFADNAAACIGDDSRMNQVKEACLILANPSTRLVYDKMLGFAAACSSSVSSNTDKKSIEDVFAARRFKRLYNELGKMIDQMMRAKQRRVEDQVDMQVEKQPAVQQTTEQQKEKKQKVEVEVTKFKWSERHVAKSAETVQTADNTSHWRFFLEPTSANRVGVWDREKQMWRSAADIEKERLFLNAAFKKECLAVAAVLKKEPSASLTSFADTSRARPCLRKR